MHPMDINRIVQDRLGWRRNQLMRPSLQKFSRAMLDFLDSATKPPPGAAYLMLIIGPAKHGKRLVLDNVLANLAAQHSQTCKSTWVIVKLSQWVKSETAALRQIAMQLHSCFHDQQERSNIPCNMSVDLCKQYLAEALKCPGCLVIVLEDFEQFVADGQNGAFAQLLQMSQGATMKVILVGLTRQRSIRNMLLEHKHLPLCWTEEFRISQLSMDEKPLDMLWSMLLVPANELESIGKIAVNWNAACSQIKEQTVPVVLQMALRQGDASPADLLKVAHCVLRSAADRQNVPSWSDVEGALTRVFGARAAKAKGLWGAHLSEMQACMLTAAHLQSTLGDVQLNFSSVCKHYWCIMQRRFGPVNCCSMLKAWAVFNSLLHKRLFVCSNHRDEWAVSCPPDHREIEMRVSDAEVMQAVAESCMSDARKHRLMKELKSCRL